MSQPRVLLVDDEKHIRLLMKTVVTGLQGEVVAEAENGREAVAAYRSTRPDLVLLDVNMPVMDGKEALGQIVEEDPDAVVVMLTSLSDLETVKACVELGATDYIRKDTPLAEMREMLTDLWADVAPEAGRGSES